MVSKYYIYRSLVITNKLRFFSESYNSIVIRIRRINREFEVGRSLFLRKNIL